MTPHRCFSRSGWWQTLCGLDAANQGFGWSSDPEDVGCEDCRRLIHEGEHERRPVGQVLKRGHETRPSIRPALRPPRH